MLALLALLLESLTQHQRHICLMVSVALNQHEIKTDFIVDFKHTKARSLLLDLIVYDLKTVENKRRMVQRYGLLSWQSRGFVYTAAVATVLLFGVSLHLNISGV